MAVAATLPQRIARLAMILTLHWSALFLLDVTMMIISIMAYTGAASPDDRQIIIDTHITFSPAGHHIQRTEIAMASLGIVANIASAVYGGVQIGYLRRGFGPEEARRARNRLLVFPGLWCAASLGAWATCVALQTAYVPILGTRRLPECVEFGDELTQCGMLTASWILAMVYCAVFLAITGILFEILRRLNAETRAVKVERTPFLMDTNGYANGRADGDSTGWEFMRQGRMPPSVIIEGPSKPMS
ncbi:hypothetical protein S40288_10634 [Stachybotrys chartarum IBT 40288]|nr:hypothetical protein S40288_10634 [Stachybotrys chartarum IBT 40288]